MIKNLLFCLTTNLKLVTTFTSYIILFMNLSLLCVNSLNAASTTQGVNYFNSSLGKNSLGDGKDPINFKADNITFNGNLGLIIATGNIIITQGTQIIKADKAYIQKDKNYILAKGNIYIKDETGKEIFGDQIEIKNSLNNAIIDNIKILFNDNSLMAAQKVTKNNDVTITCNAGYTSCPFSKFFTPFWSVKAKKIIYNEKTQVIRLYNGWLQIKNIPIIWLPYLSYSSPKVERRAGLLSPSVGKHSVLGYYYTQPLFIPLGNHSDLYLGLTYYQKEVPFMKKLSSSSGYTAPLFQARYLSYIKNGELNLTGNFTPNKNNDWAFFSNLRKDLNDTFRVTANFNDATSRNFLTLYKINGYTSNESFLWQKLSVEGFFSNQDYFQIKLDGSRNANLNINRFSNPYILPQINYNHFGSTTSYGKVDVNVQYTNLLTNKLSGNDNAQPKTLDNFDFNKLAMVLKHNISRATSFGVFSLRSEAQSVNYYKLYLNSTTNSAQQKLFDNYLGGSIAATAQYPIVSNFNSYNSIVTPIAQLSYSSLFFNKRHGLSYLDPTTIDISALNLFENNKFSGFDGYEKGSRFNYGVQWDLINSKGLSGQMLFGQSINLKNNEKSNYLLYLSLQPSPYIKLSYSASINSQATKFEQNNFNLFLGNNLFGSYISYRSLNNLDKSIYRVSSLEELQPGIYAKLTPNLQLTATSTFNLKNIYNSGFKSLNHLQSFDTTLMWQNSCFAFSIKVSRSFYGDININPSNSYQFAFILKNLGGTEVSSSNSTSLNPFQRAK